MNEDDVLIRSEVASADVVDQPRERFRRVDVFDQDAFGSREQHHRFDARVGRLAVTGTEIAWLKEDVVWRESCLNAGQLGGAVGRCGEFITAVPRPDHRGNARDGISNSQGFRAESHPRAGRASGRNVGCRRFKTAGCRLLDDLRHANRIAQRGERQHDRAVPEINLAALRPKSLRDLSDLLVECRADGFLNDLDARADDLVEQQVPLHDIRLCRRLAATEHQMNIESDLRARGRCLPTVVALHPRAPHDEIGSLGQRIRDQELVVPRLIPAKQQPRAVIPLDPHTRPVCTHGLAKPRQQFQWRWQVSQRRSRDTSNSRSQFFGGQEAGGLRHGTLLCGGVIEDSQTIASTRLRDTILVEDSERGASCFVDSGWRR